MEATAFQYKEKKTQSQVTINKTNLKVNDSQKHHEGWPLLQTEMLRLLDLAYYGAGKL